MQWAVSLGLPLRVVVTSARESGHGQAKGKRTQRSDASGSALIETLKLWGAACTDAGVVLETSFWLGGTDVGMTHCLRACGLCVVAEFQYECFRQELLVRCGHAPAAAVLLCPRRGTHVRRMAVLYDHMNPNAAYLETAAHLCQALGVQPLILTLARTARDGRLKRSHAEGVCASLGVAAEFDDIVTADSRTALGRQLAVQQCSHLIIERGEGTAVWPRLHGDWLAPWRGLSDALSILALPETTALDVPQRTHRIRTTAATR